CEGNYIRFHDVEMYPKPLQQPPPIYSAGNSDGAIQRAAELCEGWLPAGLSPEAVAAGKEKLERWAEAAGRDPSTIVIAPQLIICVAETRDKARETFQESQLYHHLVSLQSSTMKDVAIEEYMTTNLLGTPEDISRQVE